ncbi:hypothetical protein [Thiovibrio frasassiensis]|uniref:Zinc ribbon domain-containing protein n=1 Tax=Thiovibrio frasassiensis TaxID=2984131 RepID=A0A9X4RL01_9BACT|nr:hypothetical protein [Thiovibrio frasassiensis]MDG4475085.1 hypothetical protein [Thiovibrio frasassiensis]
MRTRTCPFCKEEIHGQAMVCRYCTRDLPPVAQRQKKNSHTWLAAITAAGIIVSGAAFLAAEFLRERKNWLTEPPRRPTPQNPPD